MVAYVRNKTSSLHCIGFNFVRDFCGGRPKLQSKLVVLVEEESTGLYRLSEDIGEENNNIESDPARAVELKRELDAWHAQHRPAIFDPLGTWDP